MNSQYCPTCNTQVKKSERYPKYVCRDCESRATSPDGRRLAFNTDEGGFVARYLDCDGGETGETTREQICYIDGIKCHAREAYMGGIVIIPVQ